MWISRICYYWNRLIRVLGDGVKVLGRFSGLTGCFSWIVELFLWVCIFFNIRLVVSLICVYFMVCKLYVNKVVWKRKTKSIFIYEENLRYTDVLVLNIFKGIWGKDVSFFRRKRCLSGLVWLGFFLLSLCDIRGFFVFFERNNYIYYVCCEF